MSLYDRDELLYAEAAAGADQTGVLHVQAVHAAALHGGGQRGGDPGQVAVTVLGQQVHLVAHHHHRAGAAWRRQRWIVLGPLNRTDGGDFNWVRKQTDISSRPNDAGDLGGQGPQAQITQKLTSITRNKPPRLQTNK